MTLSADELEILEYLRSWKGEAVSMLEICRCAGGRKKYRAAPDWAKCMMSRLVESNIVQVNDRGHYRLAVEDALAMEILSASLGKKISEKPQPAESKVVGDNFFPASGEDDPEADTKWWISPQILELPKKGKRNK